MISAQSLKKRFKQLMGETPTSSQYNEEGEFITTLAETAWIRLYVIRVLVDPESVTIEVEFSLPKAIVSQPCKPKMKKGQKNLTDMITHLEYLRRLYENGFTVEFTGCECLWTATRTFSKQPKEDLFTVLQPP